MIIPKKLWQFQLSFICLTTDFNVMVQGKPNKSKSSWNSKPTNGYGRYEYSNEDWYIGYWQNGEREGYGTYHYGPDDNRKSYAGYWKNDEKDGYGKLIYRDGDVYEGKFRDGWREGEGKFTWSDGTVYEGDFKKGDIRQELRYLSKYAILGNPKKCTEICGMS